MRALDTKKMERQQEKKKEKNTKTNLGRVTGRQGKRALSAGKVSSRKKKQKFTSSLQSLPRPPDLTQQLSL